MLPWGSAAIYEKACFSYLHRTIVSLL